MDQDRADRLPDEAEPVLGRWIARREHHVVMHNLDDGGKSRTWCIFLPHDERAIPVDPPDYRTHLTVPRAELEASAADKRRLDPAAAVDAQKASIAALVIGATG